MSFQLAPKPFWQAELISQFFCYSNSSKNVTCPLGKLKTEFTSPIAKSTNAGLSDTTSFARWILWSFCCTCTQYVFNRMKICKMFAENSSWTWPFSPPWLVFVKTCSKNTQVSPFATGIVIKWMTCLLR